MSKKYPDSELTENFVSGENVFNGTLLHVYKDTVSLPNGNTSTREYIRHVGAVCVVPITDDGCVIVERQYRYPVGQVTLEIPAGKLNSKDEDPEAAIRRELREETGASAGKLYDLGYFYPAAAYSDEKITMFAAMDLTFGEDDPDDDEFLSVDRIPIEELVSMILDGKVPDLKTQAAVLRTYLKFCKR